MESDPLVHAWQMYWSHRLHGTTNDYKAFEDTVRPLLQQVEGERDALAADLAACQARLKESEAENWALRQRVERYVKWFGDEDDPYDDCRVQLGGRCKCGDGKHGDLAASDARCDSCDAPGATHVVPGESLVNGLMTLCTECFEDGLAAPEGE